MAGPRRRHGRAGQPDAGPLGADIASFRLHLAAEGKAARTVQGYTGAVRWFAAAYLLGQAGKTSWEQADGHDVRQWTARDNPPPHRAGHHIAPNPRPTALPDRRG